MSRILHLAQQLADELRRHSCRAWHEERDAGRCPRCGPLAELERYVAETRGGHEGGHLGGQPIVQTPSTAAAAALAYSSASIVSTGEKKGEDNV